MNTVTYTDICNLIEFQIRNDLAKKTIENIDSTYEIISGDEREQLMYNVLKRIDSNEMPLAGNKERWELGWAENLIAFQKTKNIAELIPKFRTNHNICRFNNQFIRSTSSELETTIYTIIDYLIYGEYLKNINAVYDFGCGTGISLIHISELFPNLELHGLDWSINSIKILRMLREFDGMNVHGHLFDMTNPDTSFPIPPESAIITGGSLEQLGKNFESFLQFILLKQPKIVIHFEPILELYDNTLFDYLAYKHGMQRKYLFGYYTRLRELESDGKIQILKTHHVRLGNPFHDGNSIIIWNILPEK